MTSPRPSEQNRSSSCHPLDTSDGDSEPIQRRQLSGDPVNSQNKLVSSPVTSALPRQPGQFQNRPGHAQTVSQKQDQIRPPINMTKVPQVPLTARMTSPLNVQTVRHGLQHQKLPQLAAGSAAQQPQQQQQNLQNRQQLQQRPASSHQGSTAAASPSKRMDTTHFSRPSIPSPASQQNPSPGLSTDQTSANKARELSNANNTTQQPQTPSRMKFLPTASRPLPQQSQYKVFSVPQNQGPHSQRQNPGDRVPQRHPPEYDDEAMYEDEDEEDGAYNEEDHEEMQYPGFPNNFGYDFNSSDEDDDDELSEEESALLEELRFCDDDDRYSEIVDRLHEKGIDPEEIEELLQHSSHPLGMYSQGNFPGDASGDEDEAEGTVSSSSQSQQMSQMRHHPRGIPAHAQSVASMPAAAFNKKQAGPSGIPATSNVGRGQQRSIPPQMQQQVSGSGNPSPQGQPVQYPQRHWGQKQQLDSKLTAQPKKIFQNSPSQSSPGAALGSVRHPGHREVSQLFREDSDSQGEDITPVRQVEHTSEQNIKEVSTSQVNSEGIRLQTGRQVTNVTSGPRRPVSASNKADDSQTCNKSVQNRDIGQKSSDEPGGFVTLSSGQPTGAQGQKILSPAQVKPIGTCQRSQPQDIIRPVKSVSRSSGLHQKLMPPPQLKAVLEKNTAPSEASLARLNVEYMQQSLDLEIRAKKTVNPAHLPGPKNLNIRHTLTQHRHSSPMFMNKRSPGRSNQTSDLQAQQTSPQPKHQLPPRQPIPAIINPNSNLTIASSAGKPVCSVVPFTSENQVQAASKNAPKANSAPQSETLMRPQNPMSNEALDSTNSLSQSSGVLQNRLKSSTASQSPVPLASVSNQAPDSANSQSQVPDLLQNRPKPLTASQSPNPPASVLNQALDSADNLSQSSGVLQNRPKLLTASQNPIPPPSVSNQALDSTNNLSQSSGVLQNRLKPSTASQSPAPSASDSPNMTSNKNSQQARTTTLSSSQISSHGQTQPAPSPSQSQQTTHTQQISIQNQQTPTQNQKIPTQNQQTPTQTQQTRTNVSQPLAQTRHAQPQTQQTPAQASQAQVQQLSTQTKQVQFQPSQVQPSQAQAAQHSTQGQQLSTQGRQPSPQVQPPSTQAQPPSSQVQLPSTQGRQPPSSTQGCQLPSTQVQLPSTQGRQPPSSQVQSPSSQVQSPSSQVQPPSSQGQQSSTQGRQPPSSQAQQLSSEVPPPSSQMQPALPTQCQQPSTQGRQPPSTQVQQPSSQVQPPSSQVQPSCSQGQQPQTSKADSFSLDRLSREKCVITGKGKNQTLVANMVYQIRSPINGAYVLALWNGEKFEDLKQTGLTTASGASSREKTQSEAHTVHTGQGTSGGTPPGQATYVKPLAAGHAQHRSDQAVDNPDEEDEDGEDNDDDSVFKKPFDERPKEDYCRVCPFCGHTRTNMKRCENCRRIFRGNIKVVHINKQATRHNTLFRSEGAEDTEPGELSENMTSVNPERASIARDPNIPRLGQGDTQALTECLLNEGISKRRVNDGDNEDSDEESVGDAEKNPESLGGSRYGLDKRPAPGHSKDPVTRKRQRRLDDPVTVTISSDEDEPSSTSSSLSTHALSPTSHAGSKPPSFLFPQPMPVKSFGKLGQEPTEDEEEGNKVKVTGQQQLPLPQYMYRPGEAEEEDEEEDEMGEDEDGEEPPMYEIDIRSVRVGSMRTHPEGPLLISLEGVCIKVRSERTEEIFDFEILAHEVEKVKYFLGEIQPVLYLFVSQDCGEKLRSICHMELGDEEFFDPNSTDMKQKMIVVIIEGFSYMSQEMLRETLSLWADLNQVEDGNFIEELTDEQSNDLLIQSAPPVLTMDVNKDLVRFRQRDMKKMSFGSSTFPSSSDNNDNEPDSTSSSPPEVRCHFYGTSIRLLQYPPPPAKRLSITTEDLFCLTEGEFLNDVIIDFYLQYLYLEKLSEENRRRTHIFSSFFYKRLMQKDRHDRTEEDAKKSLPERRHARVKKWTKTVDLFSKDFIVIPINENSHWYLAVICFPGLAGPEAVQYIPSADHMDDLNEEASDIAGETEKAEGRASRAAAYRTILGQQLDEKDCLNIKDVKPLVGQKQPCILMFDSLAGPSRLPNVRILREYLQCEWNAKKSEPRQITKILRNCTPDVPQQSNFSDCGVYLLQYVESFFEDPIADFEIPMEGLEHWFPEEIVHNKRREIHELIMSLHRQYQMERGDPNILYLQFESTPREPPARLYPDYDMSSGHEEEMDYEPNPDMLPRLHDDVNYDAAYEMTLRLGEDMNYDPNYEVNSRPDGDMNYDPNYEMSLKPDEDMNYDPNYENSRPGEDYEANRDLGNSNVGLPEEANVEEDAQTDIAVEDKQA